MKKIISFTLTLLMLLSLCACSTGNQNVSSSTESKQTSVVSSSPEASSSTPSPQEPARQMLAVEPSGIAVDHYCADSGILKALGYDELLRIDLDAFYCGKIVPRNSSYAPDFRLRYVFDSQTATRPNKDKFIIERTDESRKYDFYYLGSAHYRGFGYTNVYQLSENAIVIENEEFLEEYGEKAYLEYFQYHPTSAVEVWDRTGSMRSICLSTEEFPEAKVSGDITVEAVLNKAEEVVRMYDKDFSLAAVMTTPAEIKTSISGHGRYEDGIVEPGEGETLDGYWISCYYGDRWLGCCSFAVEYNATSGWIYVYVNKDVVTSGVNCYSEWSNAGIFAKEELSEVHGLLTEEVVEESINAFLNQHLTDPAYAKLWSKPRLFTLAHQEGCTIIELVVQYFNPEYEWACCSELVLTYEIPDGTALLKDVS